MIADQWVVITATDTANNTRSDSTFVTLNAPAISAVCPTDAVGNAPGGSCSGSLTQPTPSGLSSCDSWTQIAGPADWSNLAIDTIPAVYEITNGYNTLTCSFNAIINDIEPPSIYCPLVDSVEIYLDANCSTVFPDLRDSISIYDCSGVRDTIMWPPADTVFTSEMVVRMTMDITDEYGNQSGQRPLDLDPGYDRTDHHVPIGYGRSSCGRRMFRAGRATWADHLGRRLWVPTLDRQCEQWKLADR